MLKLLGFVSLSLLFIGYMTLTLFILYDKNNHDAGIAIVKVVNQTGYIFF